MHITNSQSVLTQGIGTLAQKEWMHLPVTGAGTLTGYAHQSTW